MPEPETAPATRAPAGRDFIRQVVDRDLADGKHDGRVVTRFPPEPNGYLHIGHAKSIVLNFGIAEEFPGGVCHLRFDDTNPATEDVRYVEAIQEDVRWLGFDWGEHLYFAADYFERMYGYAEELIGKGLAYVDSRSEEEIRESRGTVTRPGTPSPHRERSAEENLALFREMRAGAFDDGAHVLRARIDMASPNMLMRDPVLYRIRHAPHYRTGDAWCIYPLYDYAHPLEDAIEGVTHSLCTLEFENNRELYDWVVENTSVPSRPHQYEFARLNLDYTVMSKRKLLRMVREGDVGGWDDPRMPTLAGLRRRGVTPGAVRAFCEMIGVAKADSRVDMAKLEYAIRDDLNHEAPRVMAVLRPLRVVLTNWPEGRIEEIDAPYYPRDVGREGSRPVRFSGELLIERDDFAEDPPAGFRRLVPGGEVRLRHGYVIRCDEVVRDGTGAIAELRCTYDPETRGGRVPDGRKVPGTIHWVDARDALSCEVRLYDRLFTEPDPEAAAAERGEDADFRSFLNPRSLEVVTDARVEPSVLGDDLGTRYQFERLGYFWRDPVDASPNERPVFNRIVGLRDTWARGGGAASDSARTAAAPEPSRRAAAPHPSGTSEPRSTERAEAVRRSQPSPEVRARADKLQSDYGLSATDAEILARDPEVDAFYRAAVAASGDGPERAAPIANWMIHVLPPIQGERTLDALPFGPEELADLVGLVEAGEVSSTGGTEVLGVLAREGGDPRGVVERLGVAQVSDAEALGPVADEVVASHPAEVERYRGGKAGLLGFFVGQVMRRTGGRADPAVVKRLLIERLDTRE